MKNKRVFMGMLCILLAFGLFFAGCDKDGGGNNQGNAEGVYIGIISLHSGKANLN